MLFRCNILALVGGGKNPRYPPHKVMIWDDHQNRCIGELSFRGDVKAVRLRRDRVVVALEKKIYVYNFADLNLVDNIETVTNPKGLMALCPSASLVLACPGLQRGHVRVELYDHRKTTLIPAHESDLSCLALSADGTRLGTASDKGTLVRVFDTMTGQLLQELRRGADKAEIYSIAFHPSAPYLACSSDKGTVHVFRIRAAGDAPPPPGPAAGTEERRGDEAGNSKSSLFYFRGILPRYFSSEWSFAQFRVPETRTLCAFGDRETLIVVCADGSFYTASFTESGGECVRLSYSKFVKESEE